MRSAVILLALFGGVFVGLLFRAAMLPIVTIIYLVIVCASGRYGGWNLGDIAFTVLAATVAVQFGYLIGLWAEQVWRGKG